MLTRSDLKCANRACACMKISIGTICKMKIASTLHFTLYISRDILCPLQDSNPDLQNSHFFWKSPIDYQRVTIIVNTIFYLVCDVCATLYAFYRTNSAPNSANIFAKFSARFLHGRCYPCPIM